MTSQHHHNRLGVENQWPGSAVVATLDAMTIDDPITAAETIAAERFPAALWVWLTGSVLTSRRTPGSDLDIIVICDTAGCPEPYRESLHWSGWPIELFVNTPDGLGKYLAKDGRRPILHRMIASAVVAAGDGHAAERIALRCREILTGGPQPLTAAELIGDQIRSILGPSAEAVEDVKILQRTSYRALPAAVIARMGMHPGQDNILLRLVLRHPGRTLTAGEGNAIRDTAYSGLHQGTAQEWTSQ